MWFENFLRSLFIKKSAWQIVFAYAGIVLYACRPLEKFLLRKNRPDEFIL